MGLFKAIHDMFYPPVETNDECLRRGVREKVHEFGNHATAEIQRLREVRKELSEIERMTRRTLDRLEEAKGRNGSINNGRK